MTKVAIVLAPGFEEIEALAPIDILRRADIDVTVVGFSQEVTGSHNITIKADKLLDESLGEYDMIILPGGMPGSKNLRENDLVIKALQELHQSGRPVAAICAAPTVLDRAGLLEGKKYISFPGTEKEIQAGDRQDEAVVVIDDRIITGRGAGAALEFAYAIVDYLGGDSQALKDSMEYSQLFKTGK